VESFNSKSSHPVILFLATVRAGQDAIAADYKEKRHPVITAGQKSQMIKQNNQGSDSTETVHQIISFRPESGRHHASIRPSWRRDTRLRLDKDVMIDSCVC